MSLVFELSCPEEVVRWRSDTAAPPDPPESRSHWTSAPSFEAGLDDTDIFIHIHEPIDGGYLWSSIFNVQVTETATKTYILKIC